MTTIRSGEPLDLLRSFAYHDDVDVLEYHGGVATTERVKPEARKGAGELRFTEAENDRDSIWAEAVLDRRTVRTFAGENHVLRSLAADEDCEPLDEAARGLALAWATDALGYDALVTSNPAVHGGIHENFVARGNPLTPEDGCWLLGLFLRSRGDSTYEIGESHSLSGSRSDFFWELGRELLPAS